MYLRILSKALPYLFLVGTLTYIGYTGYNAIYKRGADSIQAEWDEESRSRSVYIIELQERLRNMEQEYRDDLSRINHELYEARRKHEVAIADLRSDYVVRLRQSEDRARIYQHQAEAGATECRSLAGHTARLDRALEEGRGLVAELISLIGFREQQLTMVGGYLLADRRLLDQQVDR